MQPEYKSPNTHPILSLLLLTLSTFTPFPLHRSFPQPLSPSPSQLSILTSVFLPLLQQPFITPPFSFSLAPLPLLFSPPISVPFSVLVQHVKVGYRYAPLCLGANQWETGWGFCSRLGCWYRELRGRWEKVTVVHVLWSILQSGIEVLQEIQYSVKMWDCATEMSYLRNPVISVYIN